MRRAARLSILCALAALAAPAAASAHATLLRTTPANGAVLAHAPRAIVVFFDDTVRAGSGNAAVANATNTSITAGHATAHGRTLTIPLRAHLADGDYSARWSIVSDDGHRERGVIAFAVGSGSAAPTSVLTAATSLGWWAAAFRVLFYLGLLTAGGVAVFAARTRDLAVRTPVAHVLFFSLLAAFLGASGVVHAAPSGTRNALVLDVALGLSLAGAAAAAMAPRVPRLLPAAGACALALVATPTFAGHALDANQPHWLSIPADLAHVAGAAVWLGGLVALLTIVPRLHGEARVDATRRMSAAAFAAVPVLAAGGLLRAATELTAVHQAWATSYGRALLVKTALFLPLLALGRLNRSRVALPRVRAEVVLIAVVVGAVAVLVQLKPGRDTTTAVGVSCALPCAPPGAVVAAHELGNLAVGVARSANATTVTLLGPDGGGAKRTVLIDDAATSDCGLGCYRSGPLSNGPVRVTVDGKTLTFAVPARAPDATKLLDEITRAFRGSSSIVFDESLRAGPTGGIVTRFTLKAPHDLAYVIRGGAQAVVLGTRRWDRDTPNGRWVRTQQTPLQVTQPYWRKPTNAHLVAPSTVTFLDRAIPAWFRVTIGAHKRPAQLHMTAASHFMVDRYRAYDVPVTLSPPSR